MADEGGRVNAVALYEYRCKGCGDRWTEQTYGRDREPCDRCAGEDGVGGQVVRVYSFSFKREFQPHFNRGLGKPISSKRQLDNDLKKKSDLDAERLNLPVSYAHADLRDRDIFPVTQEGLESQYNRHDPDSPVRAAIRSVA